MTTNTAGTRKVQQSFTDGNMVKVYVPALDWWVWVERKDER